MQATLVSASRGWMPLQRCRSFGAACLPAPAWSAACAAVPAARAPPASLQCTWRASLACGCMCMYLRTHPSPAAAMCRHPVRRPRPSRLPSSLPLASPLPPSRPVTDDWDRVMKVRRFLWPAAACYAAARTHPDGDSTALCFRVAVVLHGWHMGCTLPPSLTLALCTPLCPPPPPSLPPGERPGPHAPHPCPGPQDVRQRGGEHCGLGGWGGGRKLQPSSAVYMPIHPSIHPPTPMQGWIINISDVEAVHEGPHHAAYAASKVRWTGVASVLPLEWGVGCGEH